jgi:hypothetical protein
MRTGGAETGLDQGRMDGADFEEGKFDKTHHMLVVVEEWLFRQLLDNQRQHTQQPFMGAQPLFSRRPLEPGK